MNEHQAMMAEILAHPDDDNRRLIYADWLDDHPHEACDCDDGARDTGGFAPWGEWISVKCENCNGTGSLNHWHAVRAEFIRAQVWLSQVKPRPCLHNCNSEGPPGIYCTACGHSAECCNCDLHEMVRWPLIQKQKAAFASAERHLTEDIANWYRLIGRSKGIRTDYMPSGVYTRTTVHYRRGFVDEIECTIGQWMGFGECSGCAGRGWNSGSTYSTYQEQERCDVCDGRAEQPAIGPLVVADQPVMKVVFSDRKPYKISHGRAKREGYHLWREFPWDGQEQALIPPELYRYLPDPKLGSRNVDGRGWRWFAGEDEANAAISTAAILWAKAQPSARAARSAVSSTSLA